MTMTTYVPPIGFIPPGAFFNGTECEALGADPSYSSDQNQSAIQAALNRGGLVTLNTPGTYMIACKNTQTTGGSSQKNTYNVGLFIGSNTALYLGPNVVLKVDNGVLNPCLIQNSDITNGNTNICIFGPGTIDGNALGTSRSDGTNKGNGGTGTFACITVWMQNVTNLIIDKLVVTNPKGWGIGVSATGASLTNITRIDTSASSRAISNNQDGIHLNGANSNIYIANLYGNTMDDLFAITADVGTYDNSSNLNIMGGPGPVTDVIVNGIQSRESDGSWELFRIIDSTTNPATNIRIIGATGPYIFCGASIGSDTTPVTSVIRGLTLSGWGVRQFGNTTPTANEPTVRIVGSADSITLSDFNRLVGTSETYTALVQAVNSVSPMSIGSLNINNCVVKSLNPGVGGSTILVDVSTTINELNISGFTMEATLTSGQGIGNLINVSNSAVVHSLQLSNSNIHNYGRMFVGFGSISTAIFSGNTFWGPTSPTNETIGLRGTLNTLKLYGNDIDLGATGTNLGVIRLQGSAGTTFIQDFGNSFRNANTTVVKAGSEGLRWDGLGIVLSSTLVNGSFLGDVFKDASGSTGIMCTTAPNGFKAL